MKVTCVKLKGTTPVYVVDATEGSEVRRAWGAVRSGDVWLIPAYYPFGMWASGDIRKLCPEAVWDLSALTQLEELTRIDAAWGAVAAQGIGGDELLPAVSDSFFPPGFAPYKHQRYGIARVLLWPRSWFLWEMRTGKTRTMLDGFRLLEREGKFTKALILGPPVVLSSWQEETERVTRGAWKAVVWDGTDAAREKAASAKLVLVSYARARLEAELTLPHPQLGEVKIFAPEKSPLLDIGYDVIVADESHNLGNWHSDQTRAAMELSKVAARRYCLTGTAADQPLKVYPQLYFLAPGLVPGSWEKFEEKHVVRSPVSHHVVTGYRNLSEVNALVDSVATRLKLKECLDLPPRVVTDVPFVLGPRQRARYNEMVAEMAISVEPVLAYLRGEDPREVDGGDPLLKLPHGATRIQKMLQLVSGFIMLGIDNTLCDACPRMEHCVEAEIKPYTKKCIVVQTKPPRKVLRDVENPKLELYEALISSILGEDPTNKVICWGIFSEELDDMMGVCKKLRIGAVRLDGETTKNVAEIRAQFRDDDACRVLVGMVSSGIGIDLSAANYMIYYSLPWIPLVYSQAQERNNGPGQKRPMSVYRLITAAETPAIDRLVAGALKFKNGVAYTMLEQVACATCDRQAACALDGTVPFQENCKYPSAVSRPVTKVSAL